MNADLQALADRIQQLETTNRRWKRLGIAAVALAGVATLASMSSVVAAACNTVYAERFVLQDARGNERARITAYETNGLPQFTLHDQKGRKALSFGVAEDGRGYIEVSGADGKPVRSNFAVAAEGHATIEAPSAAAKSSCETPCQKKVTGGSTTN